MSLVVNEPKSPDRGRGSNNQQLGQLELCLRVTDPEVLAELMGREPEERQRFSLVALRVGVLAVRQASGSLDGETLRAEGQRLIDSMRQHLEQNDQRLRQEIARFFDGRDGSVTQRLERLIRKDGELDRVLAQHVGPEATSSLARTLTMTVGEGSPLLKLLSPQQRDGLLARIEGLVTKALSEQGERVTRAFTLDDPKSPLSRLISQITDANGRLRAELTQDVAKLREIFSQDDESSLLARMLREIEGTSRKVSESLTLDSADSELSRLQRSITEVVTRLEEGQQQVLVAVEALKARRDEEVRSPRNGLDFQAALADVVAREAVRLQDTFEDVNAKTGLLPRSKKGDLIIELGAETSAPGAKIVFEAKDVQGFGLKDARKELADARANRGAELGIFVFSRATAPAGLEPIARHERDLFVVWDQDDPSTDLALRMAISLARAMAVGARASANKTEVSLAEMEKVIEAVTKDMKTLDDLAKTARSVQESGGKLVDQAGKLKVSLQRQLDRLQEHVGGLRAEASGSTGNQG